MQGFFIKVKIMDILQQAAIAYQEVAEYDYTFWLGSAKKKITISILSAQHEQFTHVSGLDHLKDIPRVTSNNHVQTRAIFKDIVKGNIQYTDISQSSFLLEPQAKDGDTEFTIKYRIEQICNIKQYLDNASQGSFYKWEVGNCQFRNTRVPADYVLAIPINDKQNMYFFLKRQMQGKKENREEPMKLYVFSAFPDSVRLSEGQQRPFPILKISRKHIKTKQEQELYRHKKCPTDI